MRPPVPAFVIVIAAAMTLLLIVLALAAGLLLTEQTVDMVVQHADAARIIHFGDSQPVYQAEAVDGGTIAPGCDLRYQIAVRSSAAPITQIIDYYAAHFRSLGWEPLPGRTQYRIDDAAQVAVLDTISSRIGALEIPLSARRPRQPDTILYAVVVSTWDGVRCAWLVP